ncbi:MAG: hypothetical protein ACXU82_21515 [Caulobacteraceae bacterium]
MIVRYLPVILVLAAIVLALAPLETAGQSVSGARSNGDDRARPKTAGAPVNADAGRKAVPPDTDARQVRPAQAFPPERFAPSRDPTPQAPSRAGVQTPDRAATTPAAKDDPRSVEERPDPGG